MNSTYQVLVTRSCYEGDRNVAGCRVVWTGSDEAEAQKKFAETKADGRRYSGTQLRKNGYEIAFKCS